MVRSMRTKTSARTVFFGLGPEADVRAENISHGRRDTHFDCIWPQGRFPVRLPALGQHNVYNALAAIAVGLEQGLSTDEICSGLSQFVPSAMRLHIEQFGDYTVINDAYNASPLSMVAAIETLETIARGRKVAVLGDMLELGDRGVEAHRQIGEKLVAEGIQVVITFGELAEHIAAATLEGGVDVTVACRSHDEAQEALRKLVRPGDTVLLKGSRGMKMEKILELFKQ